MHRPFRFNAEKAIEAVAYLLRRERGRSMNYMRLLKILYLAEREILAESGKPLTGSHLIAMQRGPVLEDVLALIRGQHSASPQWCEFIRKDRYHLELIKDPGVRVLSKFVYSKLEEISVRYQELDEWEMVEETHKLPEWIKNDPGESSKEIPLAHLLDAVGRGRDFDMIVSRAREEESLADFFHDPGTPASF